MLDLEVVLDFACCACGDPVGLTVKCTGKSLGVGKNEVAPVSIPCPGCQVINHVLFSPDDGNVIHVFAEKPRYMIPKPSYN
jgi:hypothetical protein